MDTAVIRISSKGQIVIPASWRKKMDLHAGDELLGMGDEDMLVIKKISSLREEFERTVDPIRKKIAEIGITREGVVKAVSESRSKKTLTS